MPVPVLVPIHNRKPGPTVFTHPITNDVVQWEGNGDPTGGDVQHVPEDYIGLPAFQNCLNKGVFERLTDEAGDQARAASDQASLARRMAEDEAAAGMIKRESSNDLLMLDCLGPSDRGTGGSCGTPVAVYASQRRDKAPLCDRHESLRHEFVPTEGEHVGADGKTEVIWVRSVMDPNRQL